MFDSVRKHQRILLFIVVVLIFPAFAFFGIQGYDRFFSDGDSVGKVNGERIARTEFEQAQRDQFDRIRQMFGAAVDPQLFDTPSARREILEGLIDQRVLQQHARDMRVRMSDERLREAIAATPGLQGADGRFDMERYRAFVAARGRSEAAFEAELRRDAAMRELPEALSQSAAVPAALLSRVARIAAERREVSEVLFKPESFAAKVKPDDAALKRYYDENPDAFRLPESGSVQYVVLDVESIARRQTVNEADIASFYEQNRKRYGAPEERRARHILIKLDSTAPKGEKEAADSKAKALLARLRKGERFDDVARRESQDPGSARAGGDLDFFTRDMMTPAFADAVFGAAKGALLGPVETEFGLHLIEVTDIRPARERSLAEVRGEIESEIRKAQASRRFAEDADAFGNLVYEQPDSLKPAVDRFGVGLQQLDDVARSGSASLPRDHPLNHPRVLAALFSPDSVASRRNTEAIDVGSGRLVSARLMEHRPSRVKPFDEVTAEVRDALVRKESATLAREAGESRLKALKEGGGSEGLSTPKEVSRSGQSGLPPQAMEAVFKAATGTLPAYVGVELGEQGYGVYRISKVMVPDEAEVSKRAEEIRQQVAQALAQQDIADYVESLKARADIKRSTSRLAVGSPQ